MRREDFAAPAGEAVSISSVGQRPWLALVNGFGLTLGDSLIGLQALHAAKTIGRFAGHDVVTFRLRPERSAIIAELYRRSPHITAVHAQPYHGIGRHPPDRFIDIRDFAFDPQFRGVAMIDYFLRQLGVDPADVPAALKRNGWLASRVALGAPPLRPYILVCPCAAMAMRDMPEAAHRRILEVLTASTDLPIVTQGTVPERFVGRVFPALAAGDLDALCRLVAGASLIVSTDTAMVHLADAFSVRCLAFFTTHRPEWRVRDYPYCDAIDLRAPLPDALEFPRDEADVAAAHGAWFRAGGLDWLEPVIARMLDLRFPSETLGALG